MTDVWASHREHPLAILGSTASGKSALALALVDRIRRGGGEAELISIDSMQVYSG